MTRPHRRTLIGLSALSAAVAGATGLVAVAPASGASAAHAATRHFGYVALAYGSAVTSGTAAQSGPTSPAPLPCKAKLGAVTTNHAASATPPQLGDVGAVKTRSASRRVGAKGVETTSRARISPADLFGGELIAKSIRSSATQKHTSTGFHSSATTTIVGLIVNGQKQQQNPTKNQTYTLPGVGSLVLNHQTSSKVPGGREIQVDAMQITASGANTMGLPKGSVITFAHSAAELTTPTTVEVHGAAIGSESKFLGSGTTGQSAEKLLSCDGTGGKTESHSVDASTIPSAAVNGTFTSSVAGAVGKHPWATTRERVAGLNVLAGVVQAKTVIARAHVQRKASGIARSTAGSSFGGLTVTGAPAIGDNVPANTKHVLPGIGTLYLDRITKTKNGVQVRMIELVLSTARDGLSKGTVITVGEARASTTR
ncbi:MAG TPA: choice-of-anchor P family protein [Mycobacteriales bacterium]|jgi:hypothetical protein|nr:choice-of-anchor P family protein [Mycobacteriales bacterium]